MEVMFGKQKLLWPDEKLGQLEDHTHLYKSGDWLSLREELHNKGYLIIRQLHDREQVLQARMAVLRYIAETGEGKLDSKFSLEKGVLDSKCGRGCIPFMEGRNMITHSPEIRKVLEGSRPISFFKNLLEAEPRTFDFKWLRGVHKEGFTGAHVDNVYMGRGTSDLYTMWTPIGDTSVDMGCLAFMEGSNHLPAFQKLQETYGNCDLEKENVSGTGWFTEEPEEIVNRFGGCWKTSNFEAGDVAIFTTRTLHMSTTNLTDRVRISCDTRWQRNNDNIDDRFVGESFPWLENTKHKFGLWSEEQQEQNTMDKMKIKWGFL